MAIICAYPNPDRAAALVEPKISRVVTWRLVYPGTPKPNQIARGGSPAYLAAVTVCRQRIW